MDWTPIRAQFPALSNWTYLNTATFGQVPTAATTAVADHWARRAELACGDFLDWYTDADRLRASLARLLHCSSDDIAFAPTAAHALATVIAGLDLGSRDSVLTLQHEFPNQLYQSNLREVPWDQFYDSVDSRVKLVVLSDVNYVTGFRPPLAEISQFLRARGVPLFVDGTQSCGALQFDAGKTPVDVYAVHAYKWMISPPGAGFFYISPEFRAKLRPNIIGWRSHHDWRNVNNLHHGSPVFSDKAEKYEGGGLPNALLYAMEASVNLMLDIGPEKIEQRVLELAQLARQSLRNLGAEIDETDSQIVAARFPGHSLVDMLRDLKQQNILVAARHGHLRVSPHFYNNEQDLERLIQALSRRISNALASTL
jgi:cysteine desulfurase / selenocysteine lyase